MYTFFHISCTLLSLLGLKPFPSIHVFVSAFPLHGFYEHNIPRHWNTVSSTSIIDLDWTEMFGGSVKHWKVVSLYRVCFSREWVAADIVCPNFWGGWNFNCLQALLPHFSLRMTWAQPRLRCLLTSSYTNCQRINHIQGLTIIERRLDLRTQCFHDECMVPTVKKKKKKMLNGFNL